MNSTVSNTVDSLYINNEFHSFSLSYTTLIVILVSVLLYVLYYCKFREAEFVIKPRYDSKKKKIGKPLPPFPNGWFVALHSRDLK